MTNLSVFEREGFSIRSTGDGRFSVFDVMVAFEVTDKRHASQVLKSIVERLPEVHHLTVNFKFPGKGQRVTPVATEEGMYQILMLCPGQKADAFRQWAASVVKERVEEEANPDLAYGRGRERAARTLKRQGLTDKQIALRLKSLEVRHSYTDTLKEHGVQGIGYAQCTNAMYTALFGATAQELKEARGALQAKTAKEAMDDVELAALLLSETLATRDIETNQLHGNSQCRGASKNAGDRVRPILQ